MGQIWQNFASGNLLSDPGESGTTLQSDNFADLVEVSGGDFIVVVLDPKEQYGKPEIVHVTAHTALSTDVTVTRGEEGTTPRAHPIGTRWLANITKAATDRWDTFDMPSDIEPDDVASEGSSPAYARADHTHGIVTAPPVAVGGSAAEGTATSFARSDHVHPIGDGAVLPQHLHATVGVVPVGATIEWWDPTPPPGWLVCAGQAVSRTDYAELFAVFGTRYGSGDGSTTFNLPDLRGRVPVTLDNQGGSDAGRLSVANTLGGTGGAERVTLSVNQMPSHNHGGSTASTGSHNHSGLVAGNDAGFVIANSSGGNALVASSNPSALTSARVAGATANAGNHNHSISSQGGGQSHENMPPYILCYRIVWTGKV